MRVLFALLIISTAVASLQAADPLACTAVNYQGAFNDQDQFDVTSTGNFVLSVQNGTTYVTASNIQVINWKTREVATGVCYYGICCNITMNNSCTFDVRDTYVLLYANFSNGVAFTTFTGLVADDNTFSTTKLFGQNNMCLNSFMNENGTTSNNTICCTASQPAPVASTSNKNCKRFTSRTTIYDVQNNFNIFATTSLTYDLVGRTLIPSNFTDQATDYFVCYFDHTFFNNPLSCDEKGVVTYANITIPDGDIKFLISAFYLPNSLDIFGINGILNARLLYRNGQLLMQEGVPFTPQNNCAYFKDIWFPNPSKYTTTAQLCCTDFES